MVTGYTANEYGDFLIASLQEPLLNLTKLTDWEIVAGVQNFRTVGKVTTTADSTTISGYLTDFTLFNVGDEIIIGNTTFEIVTINSQIELTVTVAPTFSTTKIEYYVPSNDDNIFEYEYRWSYDNTQYSEFRPLNKNIGFSDILGMNFDPLKPLWITIKAEVAALSQGSTISLISIDYIYDPGQGQVISCPNFCVDCTDPFAMYGCANIDVSCNTNLFNPYGLNKSTAIYKQLTGMVSNIFGHQVQYFRTEPDLRTEDVHLMEYSLHNVVDKQLVKILVPDNEFPTEANTYDIFGIDLAEFEIHITAAEFEQVFGLFKIPRNKDYMYIPIINRMYEVNTVAIADEFNQSNSYWRVMLTKYQDRTSVIKNTFEIDTDNLITGVEEIFGERQAAEQKKDTNPVQFQTVSTSYRDGIRGFIDRKLTILDYDLKNRWTVVSKNYYDLTGLSTNSTGVEYAIKSKLATEDNLAVTLWFAPQFEITDTNEYVLFGDLAAIGGFKLFISNTKFKISVAGNDYEFTHGKTLQKGEWYGLVLNFNNKFLQLALSLYRLDLNNNRGMIPGGRPQDSSNNLIEEFAGLLSIGQPIVWDAGSNYHIRGNKTYMTNIRVFNAVIEYEQHNNILNQYVVRDNQLAILIDNSIPSLGYQRFKNAR